MKKAIAATGGEFTGVRTGRASASLLDRVMVDYYGTKTPLNQLATVMVPEPQLIVIQPWDKSSIGNIEKAILKSDLGLTPSSDGNVIRLPFPPLTEERRKELVRVVRKMAEEGRIAIRNVRRDAKEALEDLKKDGEISEDEFERAKEKLQKITDKYVSEIDEMLKHKEEEIMGL
ncbi:MAG: ribosome recycling factor [Actinomycetota bacterium]